MENVAKVHIPKNDGLFCFGGPLCSGLHNKDYSIGSITAHPISGNYLYGRYLRLKVSPKP